MNHTIITTIIIFFILLIIIAFIKKESYQDQETKCVSTKPVDIIYYPDKKPLEIKYEFRVEKRGGRCIEICFANKTDCPPEYDRERQWLNGNTHTGWKYI